MERHNGCHRTINLLCGFFFVSFDVSGRVGTDENIIHEKAVKMRKMTDEQLVHYVEDRVEKARSEGKNEAKKGGSLRKFLESLASQGVIPGVGSATVDKVRKYAEECGFFE